MNLAHLHLLLNHWPIIGAFVGVGLFVVSLAAKSADLRQASLALFVLIALLAIPAYLSGNAAAESIKELPDLSTALIQTHEGAAMMAFLSLEITGVFALLALWPFSRAGKDPSSKPQSAPQWNIALLFFSLATAVLMAIAGNTGGHIRHAEIVPESGGSSVVGAAGAELIRAANHVAVGYSRWVWPGLETLHFLGLILLLGTVGLVNIRVLGFLKQLPLAPLHRFVPWGIAGLIINVITGFLFFLGMPFFYVFNAYFQTKILVIMLAGANLLLFHCTGAFRAWENVGPNEDAPLFAKLVAASSLVMWVAVVVIGRYIPLGE